MTDTKLNIIDNDLCLTRNGDGGILRCYKPFSKIAEFRKVAPNRIIVREDTENYDDNKSNIYCLDDNFKIVWFSDQPFNKDTFPNQIVWDKEINDNGTSWNDYVVDNINTMTCSSWKGFTVSISYKTGKIIKSLFTK